MSHPVNTEIIESLIARLAEIVAELQDMGVKKEEIIEALSKGDL